MTSIRLLSDLHLELNPIKNINFKKQADVCILAGDIGNPFEDHYIEFLEKVSLQHDKTIIVTGNHEYYNNSIHETDQHIRILLEDEYDVHFLQKDTLVYKNINFIGCTLWSNPTDKTLAKYMNDFTKIKDFDFDKYVEMHNDHKTYLENSLSTNHINCVITHHLPLHQLIDEKYKDDPLNSFFASDINIQPTVHCYGHTHKQCNKVINNTIYHCNPKGYGNEEPDFTFDYVFKL